MSTITFYIAMAICLVILQTRTQILSKYRWGVKIQPWYSPGPKVNELWSCS
jgi:hypothetical protein